MYQAQVQMFTCLRGTLALHTYKHAYNMLFGLRKPTVALNTSHQSAGEDTVQASHVGLPPPQSTPTPTPAPSHWPNTSTTLHSLSH